MILLLTCHHRTVFCLVCIKKCLDLAGCLYDRSWDLPAARTCLFDHADISHLPSSAIKLWSLLTFAARLGQVVLLSSEAGCCESILAACAYNPIGDTRVRAGELQALNPNSVTLLSFLTPRHMVIVA